MNNPGILLLRIILMLLILGRGEGAFCQENLTIYFYSPEINTTRNIILKNTFDLYLEELGGYQFQPVDNRETFEALVESEDSAIFMMSSWHSAYLNNEINRKKNASILGLRGLKNGSDNYRKILVGKSTSIDFNSMTVATSGTKEYSIAILKEIYPKYSEDDFSKLNILVVPKDIDALMSVGFGLADFALTTKLSLDKLSILYKKQHQQLHILGESQALKRLAVIFRQSSPLEYQQALSVLKQMNQNEKGRRGLNMLGLDNWQVVGEKLSQDRRPEQ